MNLDDLRRDYHRKICEENIRIKTNRNGVEYPNFADAGNSSSIDFAWGIINQLGCALNKKDVKGQTAGGNFENLTMEFIQKSFSILHHLRPGTWHYSVSNAISEFEQYAHLAVLGQMAKEFGELASIIGQDYIVKPDIVVGRYPVSDDEINSKSTIIEKSSEIAELTPLREVNHPGKGIILHASISCKWTIRSDRTQNTRTEALNLIRNRKGNLPHVVAVTAEPLPTRIAALALGTGDLDCVYHFALNELRSTIQAAGNPDQLDMLDTLILGRRLRDISDLPFDLAI